ncbi:hypothetical protein [uncultured Psychrobacter sp.]|uniref:hypothetical protein n=1 Tax=uncultured Psychrobacter sp. TaxID=259303 RepID=UPI0030DB72B9
MSKSIIPEPPKMKSNMRYFHVAYNTIESSGLWSHGSIAFANETMFNKGNLQAVIKEQYGLKSAVIVDWQEFKSAEDFDNFNSPEYAERLDRPVRWFSVRYNSLNENGDQGYGNSEVMAKGMFSQEWYCSSKEDQYGLSRVSITGWTEFDNETDFNIFTGQ